MMPNGADHRRRASDAQNETEASSRRSVHLHCSAKCLPPDHLPTCEQRSTSAQCAKPPRLNRDENLPADPIVFDDAAVLVLLLILSPAPRVMEGRVNDCCYAHHGQAE
jgi:hypothetical protein